MAWHNMLVRSPNLDVVPLHKHSLHLHRLAWTALCAEGFGANLQHYQKGLTERIVQEWNLPTDWVLKAQLVFGTPDGPPRGGIEKTFADIESRVKVFGDEVVDF